MSTVNIIITGASSGLGLGMAEIFASKGHTLVLCARRIDRLQSIKSDLEARFPQSTVYIYELDVNQYERVDQVFQQAKQITGYIDRIIVNAGIGRGQPIGSGKPKANLATAQTNFVAALMQLESAMKIVKEQNDGHVVAISSISAFHGLPNAQTVYAATKAGLSALMEGLRVELVHSPITLTTIHPGYIRTDINNFAASLPFEVDVKTGSMAIVKAIEKRKAEACVPGWPWTLISWLLKFLPLALTSRMLK